jgi:hypothetical protein
VLINVANSELLIVAVAVPLGVKIYGSPSVDPLPDHDPPEVVAEATVILTLLVPKKKKGIVGFVNVALGKGVFENEDAEIPNNKNKVNKYLNEVLNFCKALPLRFFIKKSLVKKTL